MSLTLWNIDRTIQQLTDTIREMSEAGEPPAEAETALREYITAEVSKVDGIAEMLRKWKCDKYMAEQQRDRLKNVIENIDKDIRRLEDICIDVIQVSPQAIISRTGGRSLAGHDSVLRVQNNGGKETLDVYDESLVPDLFRLSFVTCGKLEWERFLEGWNLEYTKVSFGIDTDAVRRCLKSGGEVPGARLVPRGCHLRVVDR